MSNYHQLAISDATAIPGAKRGASGGRHRATSSYIQRQSSQLDGMSGHIQRLTATLWLRLRTGHLVPAPDHLPARHDRTPPKQVGGWSARHIETSRSRGAVASAHLPALFRAVQAQWDLLARAPVPEHRQEAIYTDAGRTVFPNSL